jgi:hypothetical protein
MARTSRQSLGKSGVEPLHGPIRTLVTTAGYVVRTNPRSGSSRTPSPLGHRVSSPITVAAARSGTMAVRAAA